MKKFNFLSRALKSKALSGFSLVELSVVILVVSFLLVEWVSLISGSAINNKAAITNYRTKVIYSAIKSFVAQNKRLPCPAPINESKSTSTSYGTEGSCNAGSGIYVSENLVYGMVPIATLGLGKEIAEDGYGAKFVYVVDKIFATTVDGSAFKDNEGSIAIKKYTKLGNNHVEGNEEQHAVIAIISYGQNQSGSVLANSTEISNNSSDADEFDNSLSTVDGDIIFQTSRSSVFDDLVFFKNKNDFLIDSQTYFLKESNVGAATSNSVGVVESDSLNSSCLLREFGMIERMIEQGSDVKACDANNNFVGQISYTCIDKKLSIHSTTCACKAGYAGSNCDNCQSGYTMINGVCHKKCSIQGIEGIRSRVVDAGSGISVACDAEGYSSSKAITYTCLNGDFSYTGSCGSCAAGYSLYNGQCQPNCNISVVGVKSRPPVNSGFGELSCDDVGYNSSDSVTYACTNGVFAIVNGTSCNICEDGYTYYNNSCQSNCTFKILGLIETSVKPGASILKCDSASHFVGEVEYSCGAGEPRFSSNGSCSCEAEYSLFSEKCRKQCSINIAGSSLKTANYGSSGLAPCDQSSRYEGSFPYDCDAEGKQISGTCKCQAGYAGTNCASCASGYSLVGGLCQKQCAVNIKGSTTKIVDYGVANISCNAFGYSGLTTSYNCQNGNTITGTCNCATGYGGTDCNICSTGYSMVDGSCQKQCKFSYVGVSNTIVDAGSGNASCDQIGYAGTISYTCSGGNFSSTQKCYCNSDAGYEMYNGTCQKACILNNVTGVLNGAIVLEGKVTKKCDAPNYSTTDSVSGTCKDKVFTVDAASGVCDSCDANSNFYQSQCYKKCTLNAGGGYTRSVNYAGGKRQNVVCPYYMTGGPVYYVCGSNGSITFQSGACKAIN